MSDKIVLTRNQLAKFLPNPETIKAFENLFKLSTQLNPDALNALAILIEEAANDGNSAFALANSIRSEIYEDTKKVVTVTSAYNIHIGNFWIICDATSASFSVTLPLASKCKGKTVMVSKKDITTNSVTILPSGSDKVIGETSQVLLLDGECIEFVSDGANWELGG